MSADEAVEEAADLRQRNRALAATDAGTGTSAARASADETAFGRAF